MSKLSTKIDNVIAKITDSSEDPSQEVLDLVDVLEEISADLAATKQEKVKNVQTPFFAFPNMQELSDKLDRLTKAVINSGNLSAETTKIIADAVKEIKIDVPAPQVSVNVPDVHVPPVKVPEIQIPEQKVEFPSLMGIKKPDWLSLPSLEPITSQLKAISEAIGRFKLPKMSKDAIPVKLVYDDKVYRAGGGSFSATGGAFAQPLPNDPNTNGNSVLTYDGAGNLIKVEKTIDGKTYTRDFTYDGSNNLITMSTWH